MRAVETLAELRKELQDTKSGVAGDTIFSAKAVMFIAERLVTMERALVKQNGRKPRKPTAWTRFFAAGMKAGKPPAQIGAEWQAKTSGS